jgi:branched-chain amino acid transport system permease protein
MSRESKKIVMPGHSLRSWLALQVAPSNRRRLRRLLAIAVAALGLVFVFAEALATTPPSFFFEIVLIQVLYAMSVNVLIGYAHLPSFGQAAFFGSGAYAAALTIQGVPFFASLLIAIAVSGILAFLLGLLAIRTSGITFANVTLAFGQMLYLIAANTNLVGGENGLLATIPREISPQYLWLVIVGCVVAGCALIWWIFRTPYGETILAIRDNPERASSLGISIFRYRLTAFVLAGALAGLAGALYAYATGIVTADTLYWSRSGEPIIMCLLGGTKKFFGPIVGAIALTTILQQVGQGSTGYLIYVGGILLLVLILLPQGLLSIPARVRQILSRWKVSGPPDEGQKAAAA